MCHFNIICRINVIQTNGIWSTVIRISLQLRMNFENYFQRWNVIWTNAIWTNVIWKNVIWTNVIWINVVTTQAMSINGIWASVITTNTISIKFEFNNTNCKFYTRTKVFRTTIFWSNAIRTNATRPKVMGLLWTFSVRDVGSEQGGRIKIRLHRRSSLSDPGHVQSLLWSVHCQVQFIFHKCPFRQRGGPSEMIF